VAVKKKKETLMISDTKKPSSRREDAKEPLTLAKKWHEFNRDRNLIPLEILEQPNAKTLFYLGALGLLGALHDLAEQEKTGAGGVVAAFKTLMREVTDHLKEITDEPS
jgi:hypothetical protein